MTATLEREIKLRCDTADVARAAVVAAGATPLRCRRLQEDALLDTEDESLRRHGSVLRVRVESGKSTITFKGPIQAAVLKLREELETIVGDGQTLLDVFARLGFHVWFRYQKYRAEYAVDDAMVAIDETPVGVFVEIEGGDRGIHDMAEALGRGPGDFMLDSYRRIYVNDCAARGIAPADMLFED